jgi:type II secretory pathway component PulM
MLDARQRRLVLMLGALAALTIAWLALWLWARGPAELEWA